MNVSTQPQVEELRDELQRLKSEIADIEETLNGEEGNAEALWEVWPYTWANAAWSKTLAWKADATQQCRQWQLERENRKRQAALAFEVDGAAPRLKIV